MWDWLRDLFDNILYIFANIGINDLLDILLVSVLVYELIMLMRETRATQLFRGIILLAVLYLITTWLNLTSMKFILETVFNTIIIIVVIIFQPELRRVLERVGQSRIPGLSKLIGIKQEEQTGSQLHQTVNTLCDAAVSLSQSKTGALIVIERQTKLGDIIQSGTVIDAALSVSILGNLFYSGSPLHDGAVILRGGRVHAAGCFLPLMQRMDGHQRYGTRHRAAIGMSENSDAVVLVVSEETGTISLAKGGRLTRDFQRDTLYTTLMTELTPKKPGAADKAAIEEAAADEKEAACEHPAPAEAKAGDKA